MAYELAAFSYIQKKSVLHKINPALKLLFLLIITSAMFIVSAITQNQFIILSLLLIIWFLLFFLSLAAGIKIRTLFRGIKPLLFMLAFVLVYRSINFRAPLNFSSFKLSLDKQGCISGLYFVCSVVNSFCAASLLFATTTMCQLRSALYAVRCGRKLGLSIALMMNFIPLFFALWNETLSAYRARSGKEGVRCLMRVLPIVAERMMLEAGEKASAIESRIGMFL